MNSLGKVKFRIDTGFGLWILLEDEQLATTRIKIVHKYKKDPPFCEILFRQ